jgi:hypothetical protein
MIQQNIHKVLKHPIVNVFIGSYIRLWLLGVLNMSSSIRYQLIHKCVFFNPYM